MTQPQRRGGERYGEYELVRYLTAGGMADLWLAKSARFAGELVIKKIQPRYVEMTPVVKMFIDEGRIAQALDHPNVVKVVDVGKEEGTYFIAMEYIPGRDLLAICRRGVEVGNFLPRHLAVAVLAQAAKGLVYAHEKVGDDGAALKVVHCDISPGNIVVGWGGTVKLVDFGIARATIMLRESDHTIAGKYNYMAPEQIRGEAIDARADLFALGIILYELTVGKRLFRGRPEQVMRRVLEEPIAPPSQLRPDYPAPLEAIVMRALERDPDQRYQTARELHKALVGWLSATGLPYGKQRIAEYLREIFGAEKQREADEFAGGDDELVLEGAFPGPAAELRVDPEDPPELAPIEARLRSREDAHSRSGGAQRAATDEVTGGRDAAATGECDEAATAERDEAATAERDEAATAERDDAATAERDEAATAERDEAATAERDEAAKAARDEAATAKRDEAATAKRDEAATAQRDEAAKGDGRQARPARGQSVRPAPLEELKRPPSQASFWRRVLAFFLGK